MGTKEEGGFVNWQDLGVSRCQGDGRTKDVHTLVG